MQRAARPLALLRPVQLRRVFRRGLLTQSYARGPSQPALLEHTIGEHFASVVSEHGDRTAFALLTVGKASNT